MDINRTKFLEDYMIHVDYNGDTLNYLPEYTYERYDRNTDMFYGLVITKTARQVADESIAKLQENQPRQKTSEERLADLEKLAEDLEKRAEETQEAIAELYLSMALEREGSEE